MSSNPGECIPSVPVGPHLLPYKSTDAWVVCRACKAPASLGYLEPRAGHAFVPGIRGKKGVPISDRWYEMEHKHSLFPAP